MYYAVVGNIVGDRRLFLRLRYQLQQQINRGEDTLVFVSTVIRR